MLDFLPPLLEPKPSAALKLSAAWDGLSIESQIALLNALRTSDRWIPLSLAKKALLSPNPYIRYLAAKGVRSRLSDSEEGRELGEQIERDTDPLVRSAITSIKGDAAFGYLLSEIAPEIFWKLPPASRYLFMSGELSFEVPSLETVEKLLDFAIANNVDEAEIEDVLVEYVENLKSDRKAADSLKHYPRWTSTEHWLRLIARLPENLAYYLARRAPIPREWRNSDSAGVDLSPALVCELLWRRDLRLPYLRKRALRSKDPFWDKTHREMIQNVAQEQRRDEPSDDRWIYGVLFWGGLLLLAVVARYADIKTVCVASVAVGVFLVRAEILQLKAAR